MRPLFRPFISRLRAASFLCAISALVSFATIACDSKENYAFIASRYNTVQDCKEPNRGIDVREGERRTCPIRCIEQGPDGGIDFYTTTECPPDDPPFREGDPVTCARALKALPCGVDAGIPGDASEAMDANALLDAASFDAKD